MTDQQRAELVMMLQGFKENKHTGDQRRLENIERAIEQIVDILSSTHRP